MTIAEEFVEDKLIYKHRGRKKKKSEETNLKVVENCYIINFDNMNNSRLSSYYNVSDEKSCLKLIDNGVNISDLPRNLLTPKVLYRALNIKDAEVKVDNIPRRLIDKDVSLKLLQMDPLFIRRVPEEFLNTKLCLELVKRDSDVLTLIPGVYRHVCHIYFYEGCPSISLFLKRHKLV